MVSRTAHRQDASWACDHCGFLIDTPNHNLGCPVGRAENGEKKWRWCAHPGCHRVNGEDSDYCPLHRDQPRDVRVVAAAAEALYDNRLGWDEGRAPYAPRAFWAALGIALGRDVAWVMESEGDEEEALITRNAALSLLDELEVKL